MNNIIETNTLAVAPVGADNIETSTPTATAVDKSEKAQKGPIGRPRTRLTKEAVFLLLADGSYVRRAKGKPAHDSKAFVYRIPWDYKGSALPEDSAFVRNAVIKDTRKPETAPTEAANPVVPTVGEMLPTV